CIVVQNLPVPFDRRVWLECQALRDAGYEVSVVCPKAKGDPRYQRMAGVHLFKYRAFPPITRQIMFLAEYAYSILATFFGLVRAYRRKPFAAIQVCNPPDVLFVAALPFLLRGVKLVFDQHRSEERRVGKECRYRGSRSACTSRRPSGGTGSIYG